MNDQEERLYTDKLEEVKRYWEKVYMNNIASDLPAAETADVACYRWWKRFGNGFPLPGFIVYIFQRDR